MELRNHFLIAAPSEDDSFFSGSLIYICEHDQNGAMGLVINKPAPIGMDSVFFAIGKTAPDRFIGQDVFLGGPVQTERGFVLHSPIGDWNSTMPVTDQIALTVSRDIIDGLAADQVSQAVLAIGCASWHGGQLEQEIADNLWLAVPADSDILFRLPVNERYHAAFAKLGIRPETLIRTVAHA